MNLSPEFFYLYNVSYPQDNCCVILVLVYSSSGYTAIKIRPDCERRMDMKVIVIGPRGKMGKLITQVAASRDDMKLVAGIAPKGRDWNGSRNCRNDRIRTRRSCNR